MVPLIDALIGASIPPLTWFGAIASLFGVGFLESSGSPCVCSQAYFLFFFPSPVGVSLSCMFESVF